MSTGARRGESEHGSVLRAALYMGAVSLLLIWLPLIGPVLAGVVGGRAARTVGKAVVASIIPSILLGAGLFAILNAFDLPVVGALSGIGVFIFVLIGDVPMILSAAAVAAVTPDRSSDHVSSTHRVARSDATSV